MAIRWGFTVVIKMILSKTSTHKDFEKYRLHYQLEKGRVKREYVENTDAVRFSEEIHILSIGKDDILDKAFNDMPASIEPMI